MLLNISNMFVEERSWMLFSLCIVYKHRYNILIVHVYGYVLSCTCTYVYIYIVSINILFLCHFERRKGLKENSKVEEWRGDLKLALKPVA